ncbi:MAG: methyl-accepting chemotaxis protein, partial [Luteimonas sp.]|nr:methyl-accepting chemotaxis protein [Luteimonas sp.]
MSTVIDSITGKGRGLGTNFWIASLIILLVIFGANTGYAGWKAARLGGASTSASSLQVNSQRLANQGREAVAGDAGAFAAFKATRAQIDADVERLNSNFGSTTGVSGPIRTVTETWSPLAESATKVAASEAAVKAFADNASRFTQAVPQLQAQLDELVRAMSASGSPSSQVYIALRQVVLAGNMARRVTEIQAGGSGATIAGDALARDAGVFEQVLAGLRAGDDAMNIQALGNGNAVAALTQAATRWAEMKKDLDAILASSPSLFQAQAASAALTGGSDKLLSDSQNLFSAFTAFGSVKDTGFGNMLISIVSGLLAIVAIIGLWWSLTRSQRKRFEDTMELNNRNQEAIMRLLDEIGALAENDLTVKATVTEDMTGAIADSINFAVENLRDLVVTINDTSVQVASSAQETQATAMHLAEAAEHQAQEINSASSRISEIASSIDQVSRNSAQSADVAQRSVQIATKGAGVVRETIAGMDSIR